MDTCVELRGLMKAQATVIKDSVDYHAWCNHIEDHDQAMADFIQKYGWALRAMYCAGACPHKDTCTLRNQGL